MRRRLAVAVAVLLFAPSGHAAETAEKLIPHYNLANPDQVLIRERDNCKLILPYSSSARAETWREAERSKSIACVDGFASFSGDHYIINQYGADGNQAGFMSGRLIVAGIPYQRDIEFKPAARVNSNGQDLMLFKIGGDRAIDAIYYMAARFWGAGWGPCPNQVSTVVETANEAAFVEQKNIADFINGALETTGLACPNMKELSVTVIRDLKAIGKDENRLYAASYYQAPKGWFPVQWQKPKNYAFERVEQKRLEAERVARIESEKIAREGQLRLAHATAAYRAAMATGDRLTRLAAVLPPTRSTQPTLFTVAGGAARRFTDPVDLVAQSRVDGKKHQFAFPAEVNVASNGDVTLTWPAPFKGPAASDAGIGSPGWYLLSGKLLAEGKSGMNATLDIEWAYRCRKERCQDDPADMIAEIYSIPDFRDHIAAKKEN